MQIHLHVINDICKFDLVIILRAFFAHSGLLSNQSDWQSLAEHLESVGQLAAERAAPFGGQQLAQIAGLLHDIGKYTDEFQHRIKGDLIRVDHSTRGAMLAVERYGPVVGRLLAAITLVWPTAATSVSAARWKSGSRGRICRC